ncbi:DUF3592 domain-containing protein [Granulicella tundricola]|nr:DUF3592 domain-containing protein [Granulicella tundricola]
MTETANKPVARQPVFYVALTFGLVLLGFAARGFYRDIRFVSMAATTQGTVTAVMRRDAGGHNGVSYLPRFAFTDQNGRLFTIVSKSGHNPASFSTGDKVQVLYDAQHPETAKIDSFGEIWTNDCALAFFGLVYAGLTLFALIRSRRSGLKLATG